MECGNDSISRCEAQCRSNEPYIKGHTRRAFSIIVSWISIAFRLGQALYTLLKTHAYYKLLGFIARIQNILQVGH
jgi:hypothetical protein